MNKSLAIHLDTETQQRLTFIGDSSSLTEDQLVQEAVKIYSLEKERYVKAIQQGREDIANGRASSHDDLIKDLESRLADLG